MAGYEMQQSFDCGSVYRRRSEKHHYSILRVKYICAKLRDFSGYDDFNGGSFEKADTQFPLLVARNIPNPSQTSTDK